MKVDDDIKTSPAVAQQSQPPLAKEMVCSRQKAMRTANFGQTDSKRIMDMSVKDDRIVWPLRLGIPGGVSLDRTNCWKLGSHHHLLAAQNIRRNMCPGMLTGMKEKEERSADNYQVG